VPPLTRHIRPRRRGSQPLTHTPIALHIPQTAALVCGLSLETTSHDGSIHYPTETQQPPESCSGSNPVPRST
jgi:hypothetical protein